MESTSTSAVISSFEANSRRFYAVNILDLTNRPGFPVLIDGHNADNDPARYFIGGTVLQRPVRFDIQTSHVLALNFF